MFWEHVGLAQGHHAINQHSLAITIHHCSRQAIVDILASDHLIEAIFNKELGPIFKAPVIEA